MRFSNPLSACALLAASSFAAGTPQDRATFLLDPVELLAGREVPGRSELAIERYGWTYRFAEESNREAFLTEPERYEAAYGGACARMGPLSGLGRAGIWTLHGDRLFFFASEQCREGFLAAPDLLLERDDPVPNATAEERAAGAELLALALEGLGGEQAVDAVRTLRRVAVERAPAEPQKVDVRRTWSMRFPNDLHRLAEYPEYDAAYGWVATDAGAWETSGAVVAVAHPARVRAFRREMLRDPLLLLRARSRPGFVAVPAAGGDASTARLAVHLDGATTVLAIDRGTGRVTAALYTARGPRLAFGTIEERYSDHARSGGLFLPRTVTATFDGKPFAGRSFRFESVEVDAPLPRNLFEPAQEDGR